MTYLFKNIQEMEDTSIFIIPLLNEEIYFHDFSIVRVYFMRRKRSKDVSTIKMYIKCAKNVQMHYDFWPIKLCFVEFHRNGCICGI